MHLYKLLCAISFDRSSSSNALHIRVFLRKKTVKTRIERCEGSFVADAPVGCVVRPTSATQVGSSAGVRCDLRRNRQPFLGHCNELHHADVSLLLNKNAVLKFDLVQPSEGARHLRNSVRELSDQTSYFPNYKLTIYSLPGTSHSVMN